MSARIKVLIVDDSAVLRQMLTAILARDPQLVVLGAVANPILAQERMAIEWPDVIVLDVELARMDGITFLKQLMRERPTRVLICSALTSMGAGVTMQALAAGAVGYVTKPKLGLRDFLAASADELIDSVKQAALATPRWLGRSGMAPMGAPERALAAAAAAGAPPRVSDQVVAIGTSTGGTQALEVLLTALPRASPGIVIVQHMPEKFTALFAERLNALCAIEVREARQGERVGEGRALIAPGGKHMRLVRAGAMYQVEIIGGAPVNGHKPTVDVLFKSVARVAGAKALGVIMTGMGDDGARGLRDMHDAGARTLAQDEASCVVYSMPHEALKLGAVDVSVALELISGEVLRFYASR